MKPSKSKITLLLITLIGLIFRLISLTQGIELQYKLDTSVFPDEAGFLIYAKYILNWDVGSISTSYHGSIIFSGIIAIFYSVFGVYAIIGRLISIVFETFTIVIVYFFAKEIFVSEKKALLSSFLVAISSIMRFWDMRALSDGPLTFFFTLSLYLFFKGVKKEKIKYFILAPL
ncbi:MAG: ArnT family glycosyltransferase [Candidatus Helarchaeota archaeon]